VSAFRNWLFDLLCLALSIRAAGVHVPWWGIILAWAAGAGGASLNLTPGGLGIVEAALTGALVALGVPGSPALTAVLLYRPSASGSLSPSAGRSTGICAGRKDPRAQRRARARRQLRPRPRDLTTAAARQIQSQPSVT
jgi:hypothetical protein